LPFNRDPAGRHRGGFRRLVPMSAPEEPGDDQATVRSAFMIVSVTACG
jgi:hypothetical protein